MLSIRTYLKKTAAVFLVLVFAVSITPTVVFHNWFADHKDTTRKIDNQCQEERLSNQTINCDCDHIVAESPFTGAAIAGIHPAPIVFNLSRAEKPVIYFSSSIEQRDLRGPPAV
jgi:hypothetical protein